MSHIALQAQEALIKIQNKKRELKSELTWSKADDLRAEAESLRDEAQALEDRARDIENDIQEEGGAIGRRAKG